jgi:hypothetical protein
MAAGARRARLSSSADAQGNSFGGAAYGGAGDYRFLSIDNDSRKQIVPVP